MAYTTIDKPTDYFETTTYAGGTTAITSLDFSPDWVWAKKRDGAESHGLFDSVRGATKDLRSDSTNAESTRSGSLTSFDSNGWSMGGSDGIISASGSTYVAWAWRGSDSSASSNTTGSINSTVSANTTSGFSIVSFTGNGVNDATIGHGLGTTPAMIITKNRADSVNWRVWHKNLPNATDVLFLNGTNSAVATSDHANGYIKTVGSATYSTHASNSDANGVNGDGDAMIAYCFAEKKGFSKFGSYTGNGNADGTFVYTGFKPAWVMIKQSSGSGTSWNIWDNKRLGYNIKNYQLEANTTVVENTSLERLLITSNGFKCLTDNAQINGSGNTYIYMAFAENPFVTSTGIPTTAR